MKQINRASRTAYKAGSTLRWINTIGQCFKERSLRPLFRRIYNVMIGRHIVSRLWMRPKRRK